MHVECSIVETMVLLIMRSSTLTTKKTFQCRLFSRVREKWRSVVGLEVHAQIISESKLFSLSPAAFGLPVNTAVSLLDAAIPGTLPVLNRRCVEAGIRTALAFGCRVNGLSMFDRKHYFYADMPAGYQITQQRAALANNGQITFPVIIPGKKVYRKSTRLLQLQLEQDSGKSLHDDLKSLIDLNRAGLPLMELVFAPDLETGEEAAALVKELVLVLKRLQTCSCRMEEGALRVDANISVHEAGQPYGVRTEIKNISSIRSVSQAVTYEIERQMEIVAMGGKIVNETRSWDADQRCTAPMRDKEVLQDYRFMPEANLAPLRLQMSKSNTAGKTVIGDDMLIAVPAIADSLPELPEQTRHRLVADHGVNEENAFILVNEPILLEYFFCISDDISKSNGQHNVSKQIIAKFLINELLAFCHKHNVELEKCQLSANHLRDIILYLHDDKINLQSAHRLLELVNASDGSVTVATLIENHQLQQIMDASVIEELCLIAMRHQTKAVQQYGKGKSKALFAIAGEVARLSKNKANMKQVVSCLERMLKPN